jgi:hypothetical protein
MAKTLAIVFGAVFVLVAVLGFLATPLVGATGIFQTDMLHDVVHLIVGLVLLYVGLKMPESSATWLQVFGVIYLLLAVLGFLTISGGGKLLGLVTMNTADHWLHLVLGIVLIVAGRCCTGSSSPVVMSSPNGNSSMM